MKRKGGWQFKVKYFKSHVVKTPKTYTEMKKMAYNYHKKSGKSEDEIDKITRKGFNDVKTSKKIIRNSNCPLNLLGNPVFIKNTVKQKRGVIFETRIKNLLSKGKTKEVKKSIEQTINLVLELWKYGIHENTYNFPLNYGFIGKKAILVDLFELTDNRESVESQIKRRKWKDMHETKGIPKWVKDYTIKQCDKKLTIQNLRKLWK